MKWRYSAEGLRRMYRGGRGNAEARRYSRMWVRLIGTGLLPKRWVILEVSGRHSGQPTRFPLGMADVDGQWFLVSMLGENCNWVRNVRAAHGDILLRRRDVHRYHADEVLGVQRTAVLRRYLQKVPGGRPHIPVAPDAPPSALADVADRYPIFRVTPR